jgi:hypothetical protein
MTDCCHASRLKEFMLKIIEGRKTYEAISSKQVDWVNQVTSDMKVRDQDIRTALEVLRRLGVVLEGEPTEGS